MYSGRGNAAFTALGFPIRTSPAQRSVGNSPELFAATHVLLRLLAPRHPPHALSSLLALISFIPASRRIIETRKSRPRPLLFAAGPEDFYVDSIQRLIETVLRRRYVKASRLHRTWQVSLLRELLTQQKLNLPFVCTCQRTLPKTTGKTCGADRDRTDDIQLAKLALSQLSYSPGNASWYSNLPAVIAAPVFPAGKLVGLGGLEPPTSRLSGARSSQLSYRPRGLPRRQTLQRPSFSKSRVASCTRSFKTKQQAHVLRQIVIRKR